MALKIITISDGFESSTVPAISLPTATVMTTVYGELTGPQIISQNIVLPTAPQNPSQTMLIWLGITQFYGKDFSVSGSNVTFLSRLLPLLAPTDEIVILYS
jgi:hypothetical protein